MLSQNNNSLSKHIMLSLDPKISVSARHNDYAASYSTQGYLTPHGRSSELSKPLHAYRRERLAKPWVPDSFDILQGQSWVSTNRTP